MIRKELKVEGMSCGHCVSSVERLIESVEGVECSSVSLPAEVIVEFDETKTNIGELIKVINDSEIFKAT